ncbi:MAG: hypothetical protein ACTIJS_10075, partial [Senegalia sp. (in: firmicutes)]
SETLNQNERYISERLYLIQDDEQAMREAATARDMDTDAYSIYLVNIMNDRSYEKAAEIITDERWDIYEDDDDMEDDDIEITSEELIENPAMILSSNDALIAGARVQGISVNEYRQFVTDEIAGPEEKENPKTSVMVTEDNAELLLQTVIDSSAKALNINSNQVNDNLTLIKDSTALEASIEATGLNEEQIITMANHTMVSSARSVDAALEFDTEAYLWLSLGLLTLILVMSSISFFTSTLFNRTGLALAIGGGIPFAFFLITMIQQLMDDSTDALEYLTITSLFDTDAILAGGEFGLGLVALVIIALVLYLASNIIFTKKDLPL